MGAITASLVVEFDAGGDEEGILIAEVDSFETGLNQGNTNFVPGDSPGFLIYKTSNVVIDSITPSAGAISSLGSGFTPEPIEDHLIFTDERTIGVSKPIYSGFTSKWLGNHLGAVTITEQNVTAANQGVGVLKISYNSFFQKYRLTNVPTVLNGETSFPVVIYIVGHIA
jgi:hypothetical protein